LIQRDPKGLYKKALAGEIKGFTGIDDPYETPEHPEIVVHTNRETVEESTLRLLALLEEKGLIPTANENTASAQVPAGEGR